MSVITERTDVLPTSAPAAAFDPPQAPDTLAATVGELLSQGPTDAFAFEHALAGLVRAAREDRSALREALLPVIDKDMTSRFSRGHGHGDIRDLPLATPLRQLHALALSAAWRPTSVHRYTGHAGYPGASYPGYTRDFALIRLLRRMELSLDRPPGMDPYALRSPADILTLRLAELAARIGDPAPIKLVSTPTDPVGWIDAETLVARVAEAEAAGWQPWPLDFDQALLRLPENPAPATVRAAHHLVSPAGRRLAGWLRGGRPTLPDGRDLVADPDSTAGKPVRTPRIRPLITLADPPLTTPAFAPSPSTLIHLLRRGWYPPRPLADGACWTACWPALLPGHPGLISIALAWHPHHPDAHGAPCPAPVLTDLARTAQAEARGSHTYAAIARALTSRSPAKRADAAQAFATLAVSGSFDADRFAAALAAFATRTDRQVLRSVVPTLQNVLTARSSTVAPAAHIPAFTHTARIPAFAPAAHIPQTAVSTHATAAAADRAVASAVGEAILGWLPAILPPALDQPLPYTSHLLNLATNALVAARTSRRPAPTRKPSPTASAAIDALTRLANRSGRSAVSGAAHGLLAVLAPAS